MFFVDKPYVSDFFKKTVQKNSIPVVVTGGEKEISFPPETEILTTEQAVAMIRADTNLPLYSISENSIGWLSRHLPSSDWMKQIRLFKDKALFRRTTRPLFPDFFFQEISIRELDRIPTEEMPLPCIIKPTVGFFSMGVQRISRPEQWPETIFQIQKELDQVSGLYPEQVLDTSTFIIEECIEGEEFAVDAYFNSKGEPVIVGIFKHAFSSENDVSDRIYLSSKEIIEENLPSFTQFIAEIGALTKTRRFPVHIELRRNEQGNILPIEINPMRFGGWCTTADMTAKAYGCNPYLLYYRDEKPDWQRILQSKEDKLYSLIVLDNSTGVKEDEISSFDYERLLSSFENVLELRKIDFRKYPVFGFLFTQTRTDNYQELQAILKSDLKEYLR